MNNKNGGFFAKLLLVLFLMLASAVAGAYAYRVVDGKLAAKDATKEINNVDISEYDSEEIDTINDYVDEFLLKIENATTRQEVFEILVKFKQTIDSIPTHDEKVAEEKANQDTETSTDSTSNSDSDDGSTGLFNFGKWGKER